MWKPLPSFQFPRTAWWDRCGGFRPESPGRAPAVKADPCSPPRGLERPPGPTGGPGSAQSLRLRASGVTSGSHPQGLAGPWEQCGLPITTRCSEGSCVTPVCALSLASQMRGAGAGM